MSGSGSPDVRFDDISQQGQIVQATYLVKGWTVFIRWAQGSPFDGPSEVVVNTDAPESEDVYGSTGVTVDVLRAIPLRDASRRIAQFVAARSFDRLGPDERQVVLGGVATDVEHARFASLYVRARREDGVENPVRHLTEMSQGRLTRSGVSARIRRARDMGLLDRDTNNPELTQLGHALLGETTSAQASPRS